MSKPPTKQTKMKPTTKKQSDNEEASRQRRSKPTTKKQAQNEDADNEAEADDEEANHNEPE
jgi:hypothetical protein